MASLPSEPGPHPPAEVPDPLLSEEEASEDEDDGIDPAVYEVACRTCGCTLSRRGMMVCLITDASKSLYSTDIPTDSIREHGAPRTIETCECLIRRLDCTGCDREVGYHVTRPCEVCTLHEHNGHYWLFLAAAVAAAKRHAARRDAAGSDAAGSDAAGSDAAGSDAAGGVLRWSELAYNGVEDGPAAAARAAGDGAEEERCPVCFCCRATQPTACRPAHPLLRRPAWRG